MFDFKLTLKRACEEHLVASVYPNADESDHFSAGFVECISNEHVLLQSISTAGLYDGYVLRRMDQIFRVNTDGEYENRLRLLYEIQAQTHKPLTSQQSEENRNLLVEVLENSIAHHLVVGIGLSNGADDINGWVKEISDSHVTISNISYYGNPDGMTTILLSDIDLINCDTDDEIALRLLNESKNLG